MSRTAKLEYILGLLAALTLLLGTGCADAPQCAVGELGFNTFDGSPIADDVCESLRMQVDKALNTYIEAGLEIDAPRGAYILTHAGAGCTPRGQRFAGWTDIYSDGRVWGQIALGHECDVRTSALAHEILHASKRDRVTNFEDRSHVGWDQELFQLVEKARL